MKKIAFTLACVALVAVVALTDFETINSANQKSLIQPSKSVSSMSTAEPFAATQVDNG